MKKGLYRHISHRVTLRMKVLKVRYACPDYIKVLVMWFDPYGKQWDYSYGLPRNMKLNNEQQENWVMEV